MAIIDALDDDGYLSCGAEDILETLDIEESEDIELEEVEAVIRLIQAMDPTGVCARDLQECLLLQLAQLPEETEWLEQANALVRNHIDALGVT